MPGGVDGVFASDAGPQQPWDAFGLSSHHGHHHSVKAKNAEVTPVEVRFLACPVQCSHTGCKSPRVARLARFNKQQLMRALPEGMSFAWLRRSIPR